MTVCRFYGAGTALWDCLHLEYDVYGLNFSIVLESRRRSTVGSLWAIDGVALGEPRADRQNWGLENEGLRCLLEFAFFSL